MMIIIVGVMMLLLFIISWIIIHLGRNPVSGGRPPSDNRMTIIVEAINGELFQVWLRDRVVVLLFV